MGICGESNGTPLQYSCLENPMDGGAWWAADHEVTRSWTGLSDFISGGSKITANGDCDHEIKRHLLLGRKVMTNLDSILEKAMATHSSTLAWKTPWAEEPGRLQSVGSRRVGHN